MRAECRASEIIISPIEIVLATVQARIDQKMNKLGSLILFPLLLSPLLSAADIVAFPSGHITLHGVVYSAEGKGLFLYRTSLDM
jgi:hypothetical protein